VDLMHLKVETLEKRMAEALDDIRAMNASINDAPHP
jgi:hypothetical protein